MNNDEYQSSKSGRTKCFKDNEKLTDLLAELARILKPIQAGLQFDEPVYPVGCIIGNPRSGTTVLLQWMASLGIFSYPSNVLTRFAYAPYLGSLIQKIIFDPAYDYHGDFADIQSEINLESDLGKSKGALACNEFQHFFRNYTPNFDLEWLDEDAIGKVDCKGIYRDLASIEAALEKPFITKASILQFNLPYFAKKMPRLFWIHITREPIYVMQSLLISREKYYGNRESWWSAKPKEYAVLKDMDVYHQIAGQVFFTEKEINYGLAKIPKARYMTVKYEAFCTNPSDMLNTLRCKYEQLGFDVPEIEMKCILSKPRNELRLPKSDIDSLIAAYHDFEQQYLH